MLVLKIHYGIVLCVIRHNELWRRVDGRTNDEICFFAVYCDKNSVEKNNKSGQVTVNYYHILGSCFQRKYCYVLQEL